MEHAKSEYLGQCKANGELRKELEEARETLGFYADTKNYDQEKVPYDESDPLDCYYEAPEVQNDRGDRARSFLVGQEGEGNQDDKA